jgi:hypothetical protein
MPGGVVFFFRHRLSPQAYLTFRSPSILCDVVEMEFFKRFLYTAFGADLDPGGNVRLKLFLLG